MKRKKFNIKKVATIDGSKDDVISVTDFKVTPVNARKGKKVTVKLTIKNVTEKNLKRVPWQIGLNNKILDRGVRYDLSGGESFTVAVTWNAVKGQHFFFADADPNNTLREAKINQFNNLPQG